MTPDIEALVAALPEQYQPIYGEDDALPAVARRCDDRLAVISNVIDTLRARLERPVRVLDLGCAQGYFALSLAARGARVVGVDRGTQNIALCRKLAAQHPELDTEFLQADVLDYVRTVSPGTVDVVLALSVIHHIAHETSSDAVRQLLSDLAGRSELMLVETALRDEPVYWATSLPADPREHFSDVAFVHALALFPTHLSTVERPLYFASARWWRLGVSFERFNHWSADPHEFAEDVHRGTRRYYFGRHFAKQYLFEGPATARNESELSREIAFLEHPPRGLPGLPAVVASGIESGQGYLVRELIAGTRLSKLMETGAQVPAMRVIGDVLDELCALETEGRFHGDVRPWNVIVRPDGSATLIDYGDITLEPVDCAWPGDPFTAFLVFAHEVQSGRVHRPSDSRALRFAPHEFEGALYNWVTRLWNLKDAWTFALMRQVLRRAQQDGAPAPDEIIGAERNAGARVQALLDLRHADIDTLHREKVAIQQQLEREHRAYVEAQRDHATSWEARAREADAAGQHIFELSARLKALELAQQGAADEINRRDVEMAALRSQTAGFEEERRNLLVVGEELRAANRQLESSILQIVSENERLLASHETLESSLIALRTQHAELDAKCVALDGERVSAHVEAERWWRQSMEWHREWQAIQQTRSWRVTAPLRWARQISTSGSDQRRPVRAIVRPMLVTLVRPVMMRPALRYRLATLTRKFPKLHGKLRDYLRPEAPDTTDTDEADVGNLPAYLTARARQALRDIERTHAILHPDTARAVVSVNDRAQISSAMDRFVASSRGRTMPVASGTRPKLYCVSPLPPQRTGIAEYMARLSPYLARHYDVEYVVADDVQARVDSIEGHAIRSASWLEANAHPGDRVLYHVGNSAFHAHMTALIDRLPGTVVLHDFYLGHLCAHRELEAGRSLAWTSELSHAHGYLAVRARFEDPPAAMWAFPASLSIVERATGVIVHSPSAVRLAKRWYGDGVADKFEVIPMPRALPPARDRASARRALGLEPGDFVVCAFGMLGPSKHNDTLLEAWLRSVLADDARCKLVFVGEDPDPGHAARIERIMRAGRFGCAPRISGWVSAQVFDDYLVAADVAVQLRTSSRGETSAAVLDCMARGLPTIVNANGSFADLPTDAVVMLPDHFSIDALARALDDLRSDGARRASLSARAVEEVTSKHDPGRCAIRLGEAIETNQARAQDGYDGVVALAADNIGADGAGAVEWAGAIAERFPHPRSPRVFVDASITCRDDLRTGIQRTVRAIVLSLLRDDDATHRAEPVYASDAGGRWHFRYARRWTAGMLGIPSDTLKDEAVEFLPGDMLLSLDLAESLVQELARGGVYDALRARGVRVGFVIYDTLPLTMPQMFPPGRTEFERWFDCVRSSADFVACISRAVAGDVEARFAKAARRAPRVGWFHLGADVESSAPTGGRPPDADALLARLRSRHTFLMVGTLEPRKGHLQAIDAFSKLWEQGIDVNLVFVGGEGWRGVPEPMRRTIPQIVEQLRHHEERGHRLFWVEDASDEYLAEIENASSCLLAASEGEGFGLPLIEAARRGLPIIARDIPVFREVAGDNAFYFSGATGADLANAVVAWLGLFEHQAHPKSRDIVFRTWHQSARDLLAAVDALSR